MLSPSEFCTVRPGLRALTLLTICLLIPGCVMVGPDYQTPDAKVAEEWSVAQHEALTAGPAEGLKTTPLGQLAQDIQLEWEDPIITRFNRRRQVAVQASPEGVTFPTMRAALIDKFEATELPPGYSLFWVGEYDSTVAAGVSRLRPVILGAVTTILGVVPLIQDAFWISMALTMMFGLLVGTALTMVMVPTFYATLYRIKAPG